VAQENAPLELLMSAYLDPRTKDFSFIDQEGRRRQCLQKARTVMKKLLAKGQREALTHRPAQDTTESEMEQRKNKGKEKEKKKEGEDNNLEKYLFGDKYLFSILPNQQRARSDFCLILYMVNYGRVGKYNMRKSKRYDKSKKEAKATQKRRAMNERLVRIYLFDFRRINIHFLFCRTNNVRDLIFV
jgi:hypothetical protein